MPRLVYVLCVVHAYYIQLWASNDVMTNLDIF